MAKYNMPAKMMKLAALVFLLPFAIANPPVSVAPMATPPVIATIQANGTPVAAPTTMVTSVQIVTVDPPSTTTMTSVQTVTVDPTTPTSSPTSVVTITKDNTVSVTVSVTPTPTPTPTTTKPKPTPTKEPPKPRGCWQWNGRSLEVPEGLVHTRMSYCDRGREADDDAGAAGAGTFFRCGGDCNTYICEHRKGETGRRTFYAPETRCVEARPEMDFVVCDVEGSCTQSLVWNEFKLPRTKDGQLVYNTPGTYTIDMHY